MHQFKIRIYYEDTDLAGIVYYANYLRFIERARSEWLREMGVDQRALKADGVVFVVRRVEADYLAPARFDDVITVTTTLADMGRARATLQQDVTCGGTLLFQARVILACINEAGRPARFPAQVATGFATGSGATRQLTQN